MELRYGKYCGKTIEWVKKNDLSYFNWMVKNRPDMIKTKIKEPKEEDNQQSNNYKPLSPNTNFDNETSLNK